MDAAAVRIIEVGARDGLQNITQQVSTGVKVELICRLRDAGLGTIEATSIVSPRAVPQLNDARDVLASGPVRKLLATGNSTRLPVLVPNAKGVETARQLGVSEIAVFVSATEGFSRANTNCTVGEGMERAQIAIRAAKDSGMTVRGYVSCIFTDPFDGPTSPTAVLNAVKGLLDSGCYEVSLGDTLGVGSPSDVRKLIVFLRDNGVPLQQLAGHFHDTYGQALANVWEAYNCGIRVFDSSVAGLGGCPFAPGSRGNAATEDLVYMFGRSGIVTGVDLDKLVSTAAWISGHLFRPIGSRVGTALLSERVAQRASKQGRKTASGHSHDGRRPEWHQVQKTDSLIVHRAGINLRITMDRPRNGNALTTAMIHDLLSVFGKAAKNPSVGRIAIVGAGKHFCTGMDLGRGTSPVNEGNTAADSQLDILSRLFDTIDKSPKVTIACLNGPAFGGGVGLALACDLRLGAADATLALSEAKLGLCPATISKYVVRELGPAFAREAMLTARPITASELKVKGVVTRVAKHDGVGLLELLDSFLDELRAVSPEASKMCKELVQKGWMHGGAEEQETTIRRLFKDMMKPGSPGKHAVAEFQARRRVDWDLYHGLKASSKL